MSGQDQTLLRRHELSIEHPPPLFCGHIQFSVVLFTRLNRLDGPAYKVKPVFFFPRKCIGAVPVDIYFYDRARSTIGFQAG
jgi:hypothetical protein